MESKHLTSDSEKELADSLCRTEFRACSHWQEDAMEVLFSASQIHWLRRELRKDRKLSLASFPSPK